MTLACRAFFHEFLAEFEKEKKKTRLDKNWWESKTRSATMLGTRESRNNGDFGLIGRIGQKLNYSIQAEWLRLDQIWYYLLVPIKGPEYPIFHSALDDGNSYAWRTDVAIEHENNPKNIEYTLLKMREISVPLKVGIFYPDEEDEKNILDRISDIIVREIIYNSGEVYLILFGFLKNEKEVHWDAYEIDLKGNIIKLEIKTNGE